MEKKLIAVKVLSLEEIARGTFILTLNHKFPFHAGQVISLTANSSVQPRMYSICSGEPDPHLSILFDVREKGTLTPLLVELHPGDKIWITPPHGNFLIRPGRAWCIATGTGIAPFLSALRSGLIRDKRVIHGVPSAEYCYGATEFQKIAGTEYIRCTSRRHTPETFPGRVTRYLAENDLPRDILYYLCGSTEMVLEVRDLLIEKGIPYRQIQTEIYF